MGLGMAERVQHLAGRGARIIYNDAKDAAATHVAGPTDVHFSRWLVAPRIEYVRVILEVLQTTDTAAGLEPRVYFDGDTANKIVLQKRTSDTYPVVLQKDLAVTPGAVKTLQVTLADKLRLVGLAVCEVPLDRMDPGPLHVPPSLFQRNSPILSAARELYWAERDVYRLMQKIYVPWSLDENSAPLTISSASYVNVLDTAKTVWSSAERGWWCPAQLCGHGIDGYAYGRAAVRAQATNGGTVKFESSQGSVEITVPASGAASWVEAASLLPLCSPRPFDLVQVFAKRTGASDVIISAIMLEGVADF